jgi:prefoldin subunit 5
VALIALGLGASPAVSSASPNRVARCDGPAVRCHPPGGWAALQGDDDAEETEEAEDPPEQVSLNGLSGPGPAAIDRELQQALFSVNHLTTWYATTRTTPELSLTKVRSDDADATRASLLAAIDEIVGARQRTSAAMRARLDSESHRRTLERERDALDQQRAGLANSRESALQTKSEREVDLAEVTSALQEMAVNLYVSDESGTTGGIQNISVWNDRRQLEERVEVTLDELLDQREGLQARIASLTAEIGAIERATEQVEHRIEDIYTEIADVTDTIGALTSEIAALTNTRADVEKGLPAKIAAAQRTRLLASVIDIRFPLINLDAYMKAAALTRAEDPDCSIRWELLAGIAFIESSHGRHGGATIEPTGDITGNLIFGPLLDGSNPGYAVITDTDDGLLDGNDEYDRAIGPFQFIPSTWEVVGGDGDRNGVSDPHNLYDAGLAAGRYLCAASSLRSDESVEASVLSYNSSERYLANVTANAGFYIRSYSPPRASYQRAALDIDGERQATVDEITRLIRR